MGDPSRIIVKRNVMLDWRIVDWIAGLIRYALFVQQFVVINRTWL